MILVLSPSKTQDFNGKPCISTHTLPEFLPESEKLIKELRKYPAGKISTLMDISDKLATLNVQRYKDFKPPFTPANARQALLAFKGDVYEPIEVDSYTGGDFAFAQKHIRILSGLYGLLRPLDLIQPYRLEMGTRLPNARGKDLYAFWGDSITQSLNQALAPDKNRILINLASEEYFKAVMPAKLEGKLINIIFKENQKGKLKVIGLFAKKARGLMANFIVKNRIVAKDGLKSFKESGYRFEPKFSAMQQYVFVR